MIFVFCDLLLNQTFVLSQVYIKKEDPVSYAMEMAAVNKSILTLVNPHREFTSHEDHEGLDEEEAFDHAPDNKQQYQGRSERMAECSSYSI